MAGSFTPSQGSARLAGVFSVAVGLMRHSRDNMSIVLGLALAVCGGIVALAGFAHGLARRGTQLKRDPPSPQDRRAGRTRRRRADPKQWRPPPRDIPPP